MSFPTGSKYPPFYVHFLVAIQAGKDLWEDKDIAWRAYRVTSSKNPGAWRGLKEEEDLENKTIFLWWRQKQGRTKNLLI